MGFRILFQHPAPGYTRGRGLKQFPGEQPGPALLHRSDQDAIQEHADAAGGGNSDR